MNSTQSKLPKVKICFIRRAHCRNLLEGLFSSSKLKISNNIPKSKYGLFKLLKAHMSTSTSEPGVLIKSIDSQSFSKALNRLIKFIIMEVYSTKRSHCSCTSLATYFPRLLIPRLISFHVTNQTKNVSLIDRFFLSTYTYCVNCVKSLL